MITEAMYQELLELREWFNLSRQAIHHWKTEGRVPLAKAFECDFYSLGKLNAYELSGGYQYTLAQSNLVDETLDAIETGNTSMSTAHIIKYLQTDQPPLYENLLMRLNRTDEGKEYLRIRAMYTGEAGETQFDS